MEEPKQELLSHHFSHEHPLEHTKSPPKPNTLCFGCKLTILPGNYYYKCQTCQFFLHQVCFNMPKKAQHPSDPNHQFTLKSMPSSSKISINCKACGHNVTGFYYTCAKCDDYYHILCSAAPLSVKTPFHHHILKLEYSPPYDFECDLCKNPSYSGWLYHCEICEFDAHLGCVITNKGVHLLQHQSVPLPKFSKVEKTTESANKRQELMDLLTRGVQGVGENSGLENFKGESFIQDQSTPISGDPTFPSYQFSDACFSIDFAKSLLGDDNYQDMEISEVKVDSKQAKQEIGAAKGLGYSTQNRGSKNGMNRTVSNGIVGSHTWMQLDPENEKRKAYGTREKSVAKDDQSNKSHTVWFRCSCW